MTDSTSLPHKSGRDEPDSPAGAPGVPAVLGVRLMAMPFAAVSALVMVALITGCGAQTDLAQERAGRSISSEGATSPVSSEGEAEREGAQPASSQSTPEETSGIGGNWPRFRGPTGMGTSPATDLPLEWSATENLAWKTPLPGPGASSPIVYGDHIYITCYTGYLMPDGPRGSLEDLKRHLLAIDPETGAIVWNRAVPAKLPEEESIRDHGYAANTPLADDERVYAFFGKSGVLAFDHQGNRLWQTSVGDGTHGWGTGASPVAYEDMLLINASVESGSLVALDRRTGEQIWQADGIREAWNIPLVITGPSGRKEAIVATHGSVKSFDPDSGKPLWTCETDIPWYMVPSVVAHDGVVYSLGGRPGSSLAIRAGGNGDVTQSHRLWKRRKGSNVSSPVYRNGYLYWVHDQRGIAYCAEAETGNLVYEERLPRAGQVYSSALLAGNRIYYVARGGRTFVVEASPEFNQLAVNNLDDGSRFNAAPAVAGSQLLIRSDKFLYCIGE